MRIAIKATHIVPGGGLVHFNKITDWFGKLEPEYRFIIVAGEHQRGLFRTVLNNFEYHYFKIPSENFAVRYLWERFRLPSIINALAPDLFFEPGNYATRNIRCPQVMLIHNVAPFAKEYRAEESLTQRIRLKALATATIRSMNSVQGVVHLSEYSRQYMNPFVPSAGLKTTIAYHGRPDEEISVDGDKILERYGIPQDFLLCVSHIYRYKKIREMAEAYMLAHKQGKSLPPLYIAGEPYDKDYVNEISGTVSDAGLSEKVRFMSNVPEPDLTALYRACRAFIFPSSLESCSVILIEAMANGCAMACSNRSVITEVTAGSCIYFDPENIEETSRQLIRIVEDNNLNRDLRQKALQRSRFFSWQRSAARLLDFFNEVTGQQSNFENRTLQMRPEPIEMESELQAVQ